MPGCSTELLCRSSCSTKCMRAVHERGEERRGAAPNGENLTRALRWAHDVAKRSIATTGFAPVPASADGAIEEKLFRARHHARRQRIVADRCQNSDSACVGYAVFPGACLTAICISGLGGKHVCRWKFRGSGALCRSPCSALQRTYVMIDSRRVRPRRTDDPIGATYNRRRRGHRKTHRGCRHRRARRLRRRYLGHHGEDVTLIEHVA